MRSIATVVLLGVMISWYAAIYNLNEKNAAIQILDSGIAVNFLQFRGAAMRYAFYNPSLPDGVLALNNIQTFLPVQWAMPTGITWSARIYLGYLYVWGPANSNIVLEAREKAGNTRSIGENQGGILLPGNISLPAFIPQGSIVSVTGSARFRPNNSTY